MMCMDACDVYLCQNQVITRELLQDSLHRSRTCSLSFLGQSQLLFKDSTQLYVGYVIKRLKLPYTYRLGHTKLYSSLRLFYFLDVRYFLEKGICSTLIIFVEVTP
jgi:hypothetical protein